MRFSFKFYEKTFASIKKFDIYILSVNIWISDEAPSVVGPHLDPNCLQWSSTIFKPLKLRCWRAKS